MTIGSLASRLSSLPINQFPSLPDSISIDADTPPPYERKSLLARLQVLPEGPSSTRQVRPLLENRKRAKGSHDGLGGIHFHQVHDDDDTVKRPRLDGNGGKPGDETSRSLKDRLGFQGGRGAGHTKDEVVSGSASILLQRFASQSRDSNKISDRLAQTSLNDTSANVSGTYGLSLSKRIGNGGDTLATAGPRSSSYPKTGPEVSTTVSEMRNNDYVLSTSSLSERLRNDTPPPISAPAVHGVSPSNTSTTYTMEYQIPSFTALNPSRQPQRDRPLSLDSATPPPDTPALTSTALVSSETPPPDTPPLPTSALPSFPSIPLVKRPATQSASSPDTAPALTLHIPIPTPTTPPITPELASSAFQPSQPYPSRHTESLDRQISHLEKERDRYKDLVRNKNQRERDLLAELHQARSDHDQARDEERSLRKSLRQAEIDIGDLKAINRSLSVKYEDLEKSLKFERSASERKAGKVEAAQSLAADLRKQLQAAQMDANNQRDIATQAVAREEEAQVRILALTESALDQEKQLEKLDRSLHATREELAALQATQLQLRIATRIEHSASVSSGSSSMARIDTCASRSPTPGCSQCLDLQAKLATASTEITNQKTQLSNQAQLRERDRVEIHAHRTSVSEAGQDVDAVRIAAAHLGQTNAQLQARSAVLQAEYRHSARQHADLGQANPIRSSATSHSVSDLRTSTSLASDSSSLEGPIHANSTTGTLDLPGSAISNHRRTLPQSHSQPARDQDPLAIAEITIAEKQAMIDHLENELRKLIAELREVKAKVDQRDEEKLRRTEMLNDERERHLCDVQVHRALIIELQAELDRR